MNCIKIPKFKIKTRETENISLTLDVLSTAPSPSSKGRLLSFGSSVTSDVQETCPDSWGVVPSALVTGYTVSGFMGWRRQSQLRDISFNGGSRKMLTKEQGGPSAEGQFHPREAR